MSADNDQQRPSQLITGRRFAVRIHLHLGVWIFASQSENFYGEINGTLDSTRVTSAQIFLLEANAFLNEPRGSLAPLSALRQALQLLNAMTHGRVEFTRGSSRHREAGS